MGKKRLLLFVLFITVSIPVFLSGCKKDDVTYKDFIYKGESENWASSYHMNGRMQFVQNKDGNLSYKEEGQSDFMLSYKGDISELSDVRHFKYSFERVAGSFGGELNLDEPLDKKVFNHHDSNTSHIYSYNKDTTLKVTVTWDGDNGGTETILLKSQ